MKLARAQEVRSIFRPALAPVTQNTPTICISSACEQRVNNTARGCKHRAPTTHRTVNLRRQGYELTLGSFEKSKYQFSRLVSFWKVPPAPSQIGQSRAFTTKRASFAQGFRGQSKLECPDTYNYQFDVALAVDFSWTMRLICIAALK